MGPDPLCRFGCGPGWAEGIIKHKFSRIRPVVPMCPYEKARRRNMANTIELSVCCGDAALRQITVTTCYYYWATVCKTVRPSVPLLYNGCLTVLQSPQKTTQSVASATLWTPYGLQLYY